MGKLCFILSVIGDWNLLPGVAVEANMMVVFARHMNMQGLKGYRSHAGRRDEFNLASCSTKAS